MREKSSERCGAFKPRKWPICMLKETIDHMFQTGYPSSLARWQPLDLNAHLAASNIQGLLVHAVTAAEGTPPPLNHRPCDRAVAY